MDDVKKLRVIRHARQERFGEDSKIRIRSGASLEQIEFTPDLIVSSPYLRCMETATLYARKFGLLVYDIVVDPRWSEYCQGASELRSDAEDFRGNVIEAPHHESWDAFCARVDDALSEATYNGRNILIVAHGIVVKHLHEKLTGTSPYMRAREVPFLRGITCEIRQTEARPEGMKSLHVVE